MDLESKIKYCTDLTPSEVQFSQYILTNRRKVIGNAMHDIIKDTFVSKSLVHRFCKKLGLSGFNELKVKLAQEIDDVNKLKQVDVNFPFSEQDSQKNIAEKLLHLYEDTVRDTHDFIDLDELWNICIRRSILTFIRMHITVVLLKIFKTRCYQLVIL